MIVFALLQWWYGKGWLQQAEAIYHRINTIAESFSVRILFKTWFAPWKQIVTYKAKDSSLDYKFRAAVDNLVSRVVGFLVRTTVILTALFCMAGLAVLGLLVFICWPFVPLLPLLLVVLGLGVRLW